MAKDFINLLDLNYNTTTVLVILTVLFITVITYIYFAVKSHNKYDAIEEDRTINNGKMQANELDIASLFIEDFLLKFVDYTKLKSEPLKLNIVLAVSSLYTDAYASDDDEYKSHRYKLCTDLIKTF